MALDKLDKIGRDAVSAELATRGVGAQSAESLLAVMEHGRGEPGTSVGFGPNFDEVGIAAFLARRQSLSSRNVRCRSSPAEPTLARGLSYYTGAIMESRSPTWRRRTVRQPGRHVPRASIPACGFSLGLERILVMGERGMFPVAGLTPADVMVAVFDAADMPARWVAGHLRSAGLRVLVYPDPDKIGKQIKLR